MKIINCARGWIVFFVLFLATVVYATTIKEISQETNNTTWPLIINGVISLTGFGGFGWVGKRYLDYVKDVHKELIDTKNKQAERITRVETHFEDCPHCQRKAHYPD